ncbi:hypothetical protein [Breoghania sp. L-A4]|uniref:MotE family protein n=1 Tax=Breoghania sp. L-A4 TaxID=2304600 RepID=UPI000E3609A5|nr:hypothetical protein [Breoghania sp. L-A4]AXS41206.1 hypothetical protein D1F64_15720 [Breoghania sp. L-A4]
MNFRLLPIVLFATVALLVLKSASLVVSDGFVFAPVVVEAAAQDAARTDAGEGDDAVAGGMEAADSAPEADMSSAGENDRPDLGKSRSERAVLERLRERRETLDGRERQLELREQLLRAAENRIQQRVGEMKALEDRIGVATNKKTEQEQQEFANLAKMYESMKPKDAARIFDRLELSILLKVSKAMKPVKLADVMAKMAPEVAERLTVELATGGNGMSADTPMAELPKIGGS